MASLSVILVILATPAFPPFAVFAVDYDVGVKVGFWVKYGEIRASATGSAANPSYIEEMNRLDWLKLEVKEVSGTKVTFEASGRYKNGTAWPSSNSTFNIASDQGTSSFFMPLIAANLSQGDSIQPGQQSRTAFRINGTATRAYCNGMRSVNYVDVNMTYTGGSGTARMYWDKTTGVMLETYMSTTVTTPMSYSMEISMKAVETNIWSPDIQGILSTNLLNIVGIVMLIIVIIVIILIARRRKPTPSIPPPAPVSTPPEKTEPEQ